MYFRFIDYQRTSWQSRTMQFKVDWKMCEAYEMKEGNVARARQKEIVSFSFHRLKKKN